MAHSLILNPNVPGDLAAAVDYYEKISPALAERFRGDVDRRLDDISNRPESFPIDTPPIRFARIQRFPYIIFSVIKTNFVSIIAILHGSSEPSKWRSRES